jgi:hypothetical protein
MNIVAHRGCWQRPVEKNTRAAFEAALAAGFGIETDLRDASGAVVISHDLPRGGEMSFDQFLDLCAAHPRARPLALNIKADGLQAAVVQGLARYGTLDAFVFDMAVPDALLYLKTPCTTYTRCSEYEDPPPFLERASGVWLDAFHGEWYDLDCIGQWLSQDKAVCVVSPELHGRSHDTLWQRLRAQHWHRHPRLSLCTDHPFDAQENFNG